MGFAYAKGTNDPPEVRNWTIHWVALIASMAAVSRKTVSLILLKRLLPLFTTISDILYFNSGL